MNGLVCFYQKKSSLFSSEKLELVNHFSEPSLARCFGINSLACSPPTNVDSSARCPGRPSMDDWTCSAYWSLGWSWVWLCWVLYHRHPAKLWCSSCYFVIRMWTPAAPSDPTRSLIPRQQRLPCKASQVLLLGMS